MTEETKIQEEDQSDAIESWQEVSNQLKTLGQTLSAAFNASIQDEQVQEQIKVVRTELDAAAAQLNQKVQEVSKSVESINVEEEAKKVEAKTQAVEQELAREVRPHLLAALKKVQTGLGQIIGNLENADTEAPAGEEDAEISESALEA